jgi:phosphatidylinositol alpha-mannosyltransferase
VRVALVAPYDLGIPGGVQGQVVGLARALAAAGEQVLVVAPGRPASWLGDLPGAGVAVTGTGPVVAVPVNGSRAPVAASPLAGRRARAALSGFRPEVVHVHEPFVPGPALAALRAASAPVVATFHRAGADVLYRLAGPLLRPLAARPAVLVAVSEAARATLEAVVGPAAQAAVVVANGVDLDRLTRAAAAARDPRAGSRRVAFVGRLEPRKGAQVLLQAAASLVPPVEVVLVGDGPLRARLAAGAPPGTSFLGRLDDERLAAAVAGAEVLVAPSLGGESFGVVLLEAMAAGTAVVASDLPGYRLAAGEAACFVPPGDPDALAGALAGLLADPRRRAALVAAGRARAATAGFDARALTYRQLYAGACSGGTPSPEGGAP